MLKQSIKVPVLNTRPEHLPPHPPPTPTPPTPNPHPTTHPTPRLPALTLRVFMGRAGAMAEKRSGEPLLKEESELMSEKTEMVLERG